MGLRIVDCGKCGAFPIHWVSDHTPSHTPIYEPSCRLCDHIRIGLIFQSILYNRSFCGYTFTDWSHVSLGRFLAQLIGCCDASHLPPHKIVATGIGQMMFRRFPLAFVLVLSSYLATH